MDTTVKIRQTVNRNNDSYLENKLTFRFNRTQMKLPSLGTELNIATEWNILAHLFILFYYCICIPPSRSLWLPQGSSQANGKIQ